MSAVGKMNAPMRQTAPTIRDAGALVQYEESNKQAPWQAPTRGGAAQQNNFPSTYVERDPRDTDYSYLQQLAGGPQYNEAGAIIDGAARPNFLGGNNTQVVVPITESDIAYAKSKASQEEYQNFLVWSEQWFDFSDPAQVEIFQRAFPDYYERRSNLIMNLSEIQTKFAILRLLGPRTRDDFYFLWLVQNGTLPLIQGPLWDPSKWKNDGPNPQYAFFNPWSMTQATNAPHTPLATNRTDPVGDPDQWMALPRKGQTTYYRDSGMGLWNRLQGFTRYNSGGAAVKGGSYPQSVGIGVAGGGLGLFGGPRARPIVGGTVLGGVQPGGYPRFVIQ